MIGLIGGAFWYSPWTVSNDITYRVVFMISFYVFLLFFHHFVLIMLARGLWYSTLCAPLPLRLPPRAPFRPYHPSSLIDCSRASILSIPSARRPIHTAHNHSISYVHASFDTTSFVDIDIVSILISVRTTSCRCDITHSFGLYFFSLGIFGVIAVRDIYIMSRFRSLDCPPQKIFVDLYFI